MRQIEIGGVKETVVERADYPPERLRQVLGKETVAVLGYGVQGRGQSLNMKDNGVKVIVGQREKTRSLGPRRRGRLGSRQDAVPHRRGGEARHDRAVPAVRRRPEGAMAAHQAPSDSRQGALLLARLQHRLQRPDRRRAAQGHRRDPGGAEGLGHDGAPAVPRRQGHQLQLRRPPERDRPGGGARAGAGRGDRLRLPVRDDVPEGSLQRPDRRARRADGRHLRSVAGAIRGACASTAIRRRRRSTRRWRRRRRASTR